MGKRKKKKKSFLSSYVKRRVSVKEEPLFRGEMSLKEEQDGRGALERMGELRYVSFSREEEMFQDEVASIVSSNEAIMNQVRRIHREGRLCAVVVVCEGEDLAGAFVLEESEVREKFPFEPIEKVLELYDPSHGVVLIIVRDGKVSASIGFFGEGDECSVRD